MIKEKTRYERKKGGSGGHSKPDLRVEEWNLKR